MEDQKYEVKGQYKEGDLWKPFTKEVDAHSETRATEKIYNIIGSKHRLKRNYITIDTITLIDGE